MNSDRNSLSLTTVDQSCWRVCCGGSRSCQDCLLVLCFLYRNLKSSSIEQITLKICSGCKSEGQLALLLYRFTQGSTRV